MFLLNEASISSILLNAMLFIASALLSTDENF